jgi:hypothetical protein
VSGCSGYLGQVVLSPILLVLTVVCVVVVVGVLVAMAPGAHSWGAAVWMMSASEPGGSPAIEEPLARVVRQPPAVATVSVLVGERLLDELDKDWSGVRVPTTVLAWGETGVLDEDVCPAVVDRSRERGDSNAASLAGAGCPSRTR